MEKQVESALKMDPLAAYNLAQALRNAAFVQEKLAMQSKANGYLSKICIRLNKLDSAAYYARQSLDIALRALDSLEISNGYNNVGNAYEAIGKADSALLAYQEGLAFAQRMKVPKNIARLYLNIGMIQRTLGDYPKSLEMLLAAKAICENDSIPNFLPNILLTMGEVYLLIKDPESAQDLLHKALIAARQVNTPMQIGRSLFTLGQYATQVSDTLEAICWYEEALAYAQEATIPALEAKAGAQLAQLYGEIGQIDMAMATAKAALKMAEHDHDMISAGLCYEVLGFLEMKIGHYPAAYNYCHDAHILAIQLGQINAITNACECLWRSAAGAGRYHEAFDYHRQFVHWQDSLTGTENALKIARLEESLRFAHQHAADSLAQVTRDVQARAAFDKQLDEEYLLRQRVLLAGGFLLLLVALAAGSLLVFRRQTRRLKAQNALIQAQNRSIQQALEDKEVLIREVHHRVKNNLQIMASLLDIQSDQVERVSAREILQASKGRIQSMSLIHQKLYQQDHMAELAFEVYLTQLVEAIQVMFAGAECIEVTYALEPCPLGIDSAVPLGLILNELVTNAYKYAFEGRDLGQLRVTLQRNGEQIFALMIEDDGPGMPPSFDIHKSGTLGLNLIRGLARQLRGSFEMGKSSLGGAKFTVTFPSKAV